MKVFKDERKDIYEALKQLQECSIEKFLDRMYNIYFRLIMEEVIEILEQNQYRLNNESLQFLSFMKDLLSEKASRKQYKDQLKRYTQNLYNSQIQSQRYQQSMISSRAEKRMLNEGKYKCHYDKQLVNILPQLDDLSSIHSIPRKIHKRDEQSQNQKISKEKEIVSQNLFLEYLYEYTGYQNIKNEKNKDKFVLIHDHILKSNIQSHSLLNYLKEAQLKGVKYDGIHRAIMKKSQKIREQIQSNQAFQTFKQMLKSKDKLRCSNEDRQCIESYTLVAQIYFQNRHNEREMNRLLQQASDECLLIMVEEKWILFIKHIEDILKNQRCFIFRKIMEEHILSILMKGEYFKEKMMKDNNKFSNTKKQKQETLPQSKKKQEIKSSQQRYVNQFYAQNSSGNNQQVNQLGNKARNVFIDKRYKEEKQQRQIKKDYRERYISPQQDKRNNEATAKKRDR